MKTNPAIEVRKLSKTYPAGVEAVKAIDFEVAPGEVFGLLGPNGAGKSTTIGMLTTTIRPTSGTARLAGFDVATEPLAARAVSSVVFQDAVVDRELSGYRNLDLHLDNERKSASRLRNLLSPLQHEFDLVVLDCPPGISLLSENVLRAADLLLIPLIPTTLSVRTLDQVTDIFDAQTRQALQTLNQQGAVALQNRGPDVNHVLQRLPQVSSDLAQTAGALDDQDQELNALAIEFDRVASQVSGEDKSLRGDVANGATLLDTLAAHQQHLQDELSAANSSLGNLNTALDGHQASLNQLLKDQPALLQQLQEFEASSTTTFGTIDPCVNDLFNTLGEMRSATDYSHPAGSTDGNGFMLRVDPQLVGATNGTLTPTARCSG